MTGDDVLHNVFSGHEKSRSQFPTLVQVDRKADR